jgi:homoserine dehydrogenase
VNPKHRSIGVGILGLGLVGSGVAQALTQKNSLIAKQIGCSISIARILVRDLEKPRAFNPPSDLLTTDSKDILEDPQVDIVVEVIGEERPAVDYIHQALESGKSVVTANKEVMAKHGPELMALAAKNGARILFEASVGGGIPVIRPLMEDLRANEFRAIRAIINGTTNYILTQMTYEGVDFEQALLAAQDLGYAEPDPTNDVEGIDAAYKLAILASLAFQTKIHARDVYREGIARLKAKDFRYARELGYVIKLMALAKRKGGEVEVRVHPALLPQEAPLAKVDGVFNAVEVEGDLVGSVLFHGRGAGSMPTTSAVVADIMNIGWNISRGMRGGDPVLPDEALGIRPMDALVTSYYIRITVADRSGVLAQIARVLGDRQISIASVIQKDTDSLAQTAEMVITTHPSRELDVQQALTELEGLEVVVEIGNFLRVEE